MSVYLSLIVVLLKNIFFGEIDLCLILLKDHFFGVSSGPIERPSSFALVMTAPSSQSVETAAQSFDNL